MADVLVVRGALEFEERMKQIASRMPAMTRRMLFAAGEALKGWMVAEKLSGQVLRRRTGLLAGSWHTVNTGPDTAVVGTTVHYARPHEEGFHGIVAVRDFVRARYRGGPKVIQVQAHSRMMNVRAKHYARDSAREGAPTAILAAERVIALELEARSGF